MQALWDVLRRGAAKMYVVIRLQELVQRVHAEVHVKLNMQHDATVLVPQWAVSRLVIVCELLL